MTVGIAAIIILDNQQAGCYTISRLVGNCPTTKIRGQTMKELTKEERIIMTQATPRPWKIGKSLTGDRTPWISNEKGNISICIIDDIARSSNDTTRKQEDEINIANARLIVKAVNCHDELVEVLKLAKREIERFFGKENTDYAVAGIGIVPKVIEQALSKAEAN